jgi:hypothetical protein
MRIRKKHQADAVRRLEKVNAARQIAAFEREKQNRPATVPENPANFSDSKTAGNSQQIN